VRKVLCRRALHKHEQETLGGASDSSILRDRCVNVCTERAYVKLRRGGRVVQGTGLDCEGMDAEANIGEADDPDGRAAGCGE